MANLPIIPGSLPSGYCYPATPQSLWNEFAKAGYVQLDVSGAKYIISQTATPAATERNYLWHNPNTGHLLYWNAGVTSWTMLHPDAASGDVRRLYVGTSGSLSTYDGGDAAAISATTGALWEIDATFDARMLIGVGTLPSGTAIAVGGTGGAETVSIAQANLPAVTLAVNTAIVGQAGVGTDVPVVGSTYGSTSIGGSGRSVDSTSTDVSARYYTKCQTENLGTGTALNVQNRYVGVYIIKRTARLYWTA